MSPMTTNPYINFQGKAKEAMEFYQKVFGGNLTLLAFDANGSPKPAGPTDRIMHAILEADGISLMGTDGMPEYPPTVGDNMAISLSGSDRERLTKIFNSLSEGGTVKQPLKEESWGDTFAWLADKYGINWMIDITKA